ncbi:MAG: hypothetical protein Q9160_003517 [Pyrenula sp. 1 TL-2023]
MAGVRIALYLPGQSKLVEQIIGDMIEQKYKLHSKIDDFTQWEKGKNVGSGQRFEQTPQISRIYGRANDTSSANFSKAYKRQFPGYNAKHYQIRVSVSSAGSDTDDIDEGGPVKVQRDIGVEIQIVTASTHLWAEVEHDIAYKTKHGAPNSQELILLDGIQGIMGGADFFLNALEGFTSERVARSKQNFRDVADLISFLRSRHPFLIAGGDSVRHSRPLLTLLQKLGKDSEEKLGPILDDLNFSDPSNGTLLGIKNRFQPLVPRPATCIMEYVIANVQNVNLQLVYNRYDEEEMLQESESTTIETYRSRILVNCLKWVIADLFESGLDVQKVFRETSRRLHDSVLKALKWAIDGTTRFDILRPTRQANEKEEKDIKRLWEWFSSCEQPIEWSSNDAFSASAGSNARQKSNAAHASFARLPYNFCALSLQPFDIPVCTSAGIIFDHENILRWLKDHSTNPVNGAILKIGDLIKLQFAKNDAEEYVDPVTFKVFTDNTHIVAIRHGDIANVFAYETIERLNIKAKMWRDLVSDEAFSRKDMITLQDPQNLASRDLSAFKYIKDGEDSGIKKEEKGINADAMGSSAKILKAKEAVARARAERQGLGNSARKPSSTSPSALDKSGAAAPAKASSVNNIKPAKPYNATYHTTGQAAASLTSTGLTPHTSANLALLSEEDFLLKPRRVKKPSYVRLLTTHGLLGIELYPEHAPKAAWNFLRLCQKGYYDGIKFHRNIRSFMIQGGDPDGTGRGGNSIWNKPFEDEFDGPLKHDQRGTLSMANKGKNTNSSQFFFTYRAVKHLDRKHTIFGRVVEGMETLDALETVPVDEKDRPKEKCEIVEANVLIDSFQELLDGMKNKDGNGQVDVEGEKAKMDDERTWTGKRVRDARTQGAGNDGGGTVGKYLKAQRNDENNEDRDLDSNDIGVAKEPVRKKAKAGGFGNFDSW